MGLDCLGGVVGEEVLGGWEEFPEDVLVGVWGRGRDGGWLGLG